MWGFARAGLSASMMASSMAAQRVVRSVGNLVDHSVR